jgi:hypothetical protein
MSETLPTTGVGNATAPNEWVSAPNGALTLVGDSNQDTNFGYVDTNTVGTYTQGYLLDDMPLTFNTMTSTLSIQLRYGWSVSPSLATWPTLTARIMSGTTVLAAATAGGAFQTIESNITATTPTNSGVVAFSYVNTTANRDLWNDAHVEILIERGRNKGGSTEEQRVFALSVTGQYNAVDQTKRYFFIT